MHGKRFAFPCHSPPPAPPSSRKIRVCFVRGEFTKIIYGFGVKSFLRKGRSHLNGKHDKFWMLAIILSLALCGGVLVMRAMPVAQGSTLSDAARDKVLKYIRERFGIPDTENLALSALHASAIAPDFNEGIVMRGEGKNQHGQPVLVSKDSRYLIVVMGNIVELHQNTAAEMEQRIREDFKAPANEKLSVGRFKPSPTPDFEQGTLNLDDGKSKRDIGLLLSRDGKHLILSELYNLTINPTQQALHTISLQDEPTQGPSDAPVTLVEYADLECPTCARMNEFLETKVVPRYGNKVRIVFKEFPLPMHDWFMTAAIADQCAYEMNPTAYITLRTAIFRNQALINITNVRETVLSYGELAGVDRVKLAGCVDAKSSFPRIQRDVAEAKRLDVNQTPTMFINGRLMVGLPSEDAYYQAIDEALKNSRQ